MNVSVLVYQLSVGWLISELFNQKRTKIDERQDMACLEVTQCADLTQQIVHYPNPALAPDMPCLY